MAIAYLLTVAACAGALSWAAALGLPAETPVPLSAHLLVTGGTLAVYARHMARAARTSKESRPFDIAQLVGGALVGVALLQGIPPMALLVAVVLGLLSTAYSHPMLPGGRRLRDFGLLKPVILAGIWSLGTTLFPAVASGRFPIDAWQLSWEECALRTSFILPLCLAFDIRDAAPDAAAGVRTWPVVLGSATTEGLCFLLLAAFGAAELWVFRDAVALGVTGALVAAFAALAVRFAVRKPVAQTGWMWVDAAMLVYALTRIVLLLPAQ